MNTLVERLNGRLGSRYFMLFGGFEAVSALLVCAGTVGLFSLYVPLSGAELAEVLLVSEACVAVALGYVVVSATRAAGEVIDCVGAGGPDEGALEAWRCAVALPRQLVARSDWKPVAIVAVPIAIFVTLRLELPAYSAAIVFAGTIVAVAYSAVLHFFASELFMRPVIEHMARSLAPSFSGARIGVPLRWKLLGALPIVNVVTGVVVSGLYTDGTASLDELGVDVLVAVLVAFTLSFELTLLITKSVLGPVDELLKATDRVKRGDFSSRLPLTSADEMGVLAGSFTK